MHTRKIFSGIHPVLNQVIRLDGSPMRRELTFKIVDDLVAAYKRGRLRSPAPENAFFPSSIAPLIELAFSSPEQQYALLTSPWLDVFTQADLRNALRSSQNIWIDSAERRGFIRCLFDPLDSQHDIPRTRFFMAARRAAEAVGLAIPTAQYMTAALREMESNIREHSDKPDTGLLAFQAAYDRFEFVAADNGVGVLATLRDAPQFKNLADHGRALYAMLQEGVSRYGNDANHGNGFRDLFLGLYGMNADLRFRSGDHALTISGSRPEIQNAQLAQKSPFQGFLASVRCYAPPRSGALH